MGIIELEGESVTVNGRNVLAFGSSSLTWDIQKTEGASMASGGLFNSTFTGHGAPAVTAFGTPVLLVDAPTLVDMQAAVLWSTSLDTSIHKTAKASALVGRGSGEAYQSGLSGEGVVLVQASEGHPPAQR